MMGILAFVGLDNTDGFVFGILGISTTVHTMRSIDLAIGTERFLATVFSKNYSEDDKSLKFVGPILLIICLFLGTYIGYLIGGDLAFVFKYIYGIVTDTSILIVVLILRRKNRQQRLLSNHFAVPLAQKYQLVENVRVLSLLRGQSIVTTFFGIMSNLVAIIRYWIQLPDMASGVFTMVGF
uniref:Uncharacterized protein n=1 Tax=Panagrolaimus sp. JU765 TaxID=591449 RepID=A0AC34Q4S4_9BILA